MESQAGADNSRSAESRQLAFTRLHDSLPTIPFVGEDIEVQARAVLHYLVDRLSVRHHWLFHSIEADASKCPNCGKATSSIRSPYCSEFCREAAGFVRQFRTGLDSGWILDPEKQVAMGQNLWHLVGGGRPLRREIAPKRSLEVVLKREGGTCQVCGGTATTIDHPASGCNRPINLRAVCNSCCADRPFGDPFVTESRKFAELMDEFSARIGSLLPIRCCDEADSWDWRAYLKGRRGQTP